MFFSLAAQLEILTRVACRAVELETYSPVLPLPPATYHPAMDVLDTTDEEWAHRCRKSTLVAKKATSMCEYFTSRWYPRNNAERMLNYTD